MLAAGDSGLHGLHGTTPLAFGIAAALPWEIPRHGGRVPRLMGPDRSHPVPMAALPASPPPGTGGPRSVRMGFSRGSALATPSAGRESSAPFPRHPRNPAPLSDPGGKRLRRLIRTLAPRPPRLCAFWADRTAAPSAFAMASVQPLLPPLVPTLRKNEVTPRSARWVPSAAPLGTARPPPASQPRRPPPNSAGPCVNARMRRSSATSLESGKGAADPAEGAHADSSDISVGVLLLVVWRLLHWRREGTAAERHRTRVGGVRVTHGITCEKPLYLVAWLDTALTKQWQKHRAAPLTPRMVPGHALAQAWGCVVAGGFLIDQGLKAVLHVRDVEPPKIHALSVLFEALPSKDQTTLKTCCDDFRHAFPGMASFPLATPDEFLASLDGGRNSRGRHAGSFDWRHFLTEQGSGASLPLVSVDVMHEIVCGCVRLVRTIDREDRAAGGAASNWRLQREGSHRCRDWLTVRMNSRGWGQDGDGLEIPWGPGCGDRYDCLVCEGGRIRSFFALRLSAEDTQLLVVDGRSEVASLDMDGGFRSVGVAVGRPARPPDPSCRHVTCWSRMR